MLVRGWLCALLVVSAAGCRSEDRVDLDFSRRTPAPRPDGTAPETLRIAIGAMISPESTYSSYAGFMSYVARQVGRRAKLVQRGTYEEVNRLLLSGDVDVAFVCTGAYVVIRDRVRLLAVPVVGGSPSYRSLIIARAGRYDSWNDLRGGRFAFTDPLSNTGCMYPTYMIRTQFQLGPREYFDDLVYSGGHDASIGLVLDGVVDGAAVDEIVFDSFARAHRADAARLAILHFSPAFGAPPFVARSDLAPALVARIRETLLHAGSDPVTRALLAPIGIERFVPQADYDFAIVVARAALAAPASGGSP